MNTRGAGLAALSAALIGLLAACGGNATAAEQPPASVLVEAPIDVEAIARDEIAVLDELGYPTELATWAFADEYTNSAGGTASTSGDNRGYSIVTISLDADAYLQFSPDIEAAVRSTVRHEFGHALTYWLYPQGAEGPLSKICLSVSTRSLEANSPAGECAAEVVNEVLSEQRGDERVPFYGLTLSDVSMTNVSAIVDGSLTWDVSSASGGDPSL